MGGGRKAIPVSLGRTIWTDMRTEGAVRISVLLAIFYAFFLYPPPGAPSWIPWGFPILLLSAVISNVGFLYHNPGMFAFAGLVTCLAMVLGGTILCIIFPLLQNNHVGAAYVSLMAILTVVVVPCIRRTGVKNSATNMVLVLVIILTENLYGPFLNRRLVVDNAGIWTTVIKGQAYAIPHWHSAVYQTLSLPSGILTAIGQCLDQAAKHIEADVDANMQDEEQPASQKDVLKQLSSGLFLKTKSAGLSESISIVGAMALYEVSPTTNGVDDRAQVFKDTCARFMTPRSSHLSRRVRRVPLGTEGLDAPICG